MPPRRDGEKDSESESLGPGLSESLGAGLGDNVSGIIFMVLAICAGVITSVIIKALSPVASLLVLLSLRFTFSIPFLFLAAYVRRGAALLSVRRWDWLLLRIITGQIGIIFWFLSVMHTSLGQATALFQSSAIFVTILSPIFLQEKVGLYRGSAVILGLVGIVMITNPFLGGFNIGTLFGIFSAMAGAVLVIVLRLLGRTEEPVTVALWHNLIGSLLYPFAMVVLGEAGLFAEIVWTSLALMLFFGLAASFVQIGFTTAYRYGEAAVLAPIRYLSVPAAAVLGWYFWSESLEGIEVMGMLIVVVMCLFISWREYHLARESHPA